ncbi:MAG: hypothetical protein V3V10_08225, partial [Planctomycetota bacterium]
AAGLLESVHMKAAAKGKESGVLAEDIGHLDIRYDQIQEVLEDMGNESPVDLAEFAQEFMTTTAEGRADTINARTWHLVPDAIKVRLRQKGLIQPVSSSFPRVIDKNLLDVPEINAKISTQISDLFTAMMLDPTYALKSITEQAAKIVRASATKDLDVTLAGLIEFEKRLARGKSGAINVLNIQAKEVKAETQDTLKKLTAENNQLKQDAKGVVKRTKALVADKEKEIAATTRQIKKDYATQLKGTKGKERESIIKLRDRELARRVKALEQQVARLKTKGLKETAKVNSAQEGITKAKAMAQKLKTAKLKEMEADKAARRANKPVKESPMDVMLKGLKAEQTRLNKLRTIKGSQAFVREEWESGARNYADDFSDYTQDIPDVVEGATSELTHTWQTSGGVTPRLSVVRSGHTLEIEPATAVRMGLFISAPTDYASLWSMNVLGSSVFALRGWGHTGSQKINHVLDVVGKERVSAQRAGDTKLATQLGNELDAIKDAGVRQVQKLRGAYILQGGNIAETVAWIQAWQAVSRLSFAGVSATVDVGAAVGNQGATFLPNFAAASVRVIKSIMKDNPDLTNDDSIGLLEDAVHLLSSARSRNLTDGDLAVDLPTSTIGRKAVRLRTAVVDKSFFLNGLTQWTTVVKGAAASSLLKSLAKGNPSKFWTKRMRRAGLSAKDVSAISEQLGKHGTNGKPNTGAWDKGTDRLKDKLRNALHHEANTTTPQPSFGDTNRSASENPLFKLLLSLQSFMFVSTNKVTIPLLENL